MARDEPIFDVELVPLVLDAKGTVHPVENQRLSRRDYFLLGIGVWLGAAGVLLAGGIVWLVSGK